MLDDRRRPRPTPRRRPSRAPRRGVASRARAREYNRRGERPRHLPSARRGQRADQELRAGLARAGRAAGAARADVAERVHIPMVIGGERVETGTTFEAVMPHRRAHVLADVERGGAARGRARDRRGARRAPGLVADAVARAGRGVPPRRRADLRARGARRSTRRRCSTSRRPPTRPRSTPPARRSTSSASTPSTSSRIYEEQPVSSPGVWNRMEYRAARGLRLRDQPVQLHRDRRQPDDVAGADGQHGRLEAGLDAGALGVDHDAHPRGGRACRRRDQPRLRPGRRDGRRRAREPRARRASTSRARRRSSSRSGARSATTSTATATTRASSARPAARTSSSPIRPRIPAPSRRRSSAARSSTRARSARPRRALYIPSNLWGEVRETLAARGRRRSRWATSATSRTSWAP